MPRCPHLAPAHAHPVPEPAMPVDFPARRLRHPLPTAAAVLLLALSAAIAFVVAEPPYFDFETPMMMWINRHTGAWYAPVATVMHYIGKTALAVPAVLLAGAWLWFKKKPRHAALAVLAPLLSTFSMLAVKALLTRPRPELWPRLIEEDNWSFPSGHSSFGAVIALLVILNTRRLKHRNRIAAAAVVFALLMGFSRLYLGVHYPTDVLVGWINGTLVTLSVYRLLFKANPL